MAPFLPDETWTWVFHFSDKSTLKNVRGISKRFAHLTTSMLFDRIFIGPSAQTLDVFEKIISHQELSSCVQIMVFDASFFSKYSARQYEQHFNNFCIQRARSAATTNAPASTVVADVERSMVLLYGDATPTARDTLATLYSITGTRLSRVTDAMRAGFREWERQVAEQDRYIKDMPIWLTTGFCRLPNLKSIEWQTEWACEYVRRNGETDLSLLPVFRSSGPLARSWRSLVAPPSSCVPDQESKAICDVISSLAISGAARRDVSLSLHVPVSHLQSRPTQRDLVHQHWGSVVRSLASLTLRIATDAHAYFPDATSLEPLHLLSACLQTANRLLILDITIDSIWTRKYKWTSSYLALASLLGPSTPIFPKLKTLILRGLRAPADDFLSLFVAQPALEHLVLGPVCLANYVVAEQAETEYDTFSEDDSEDDMEDLDGENGEGCEGGSGAENDICDSDPLATHESLRALIIGLAGMRSLVYWKVEPPVFTNSWIRKEEWEVEGFDQAIQEISNGHRGS